jgi:hypothetical protein
VQMYKRYLDMDKHDIATRLLRGVRKLINELIKEKRNSTLTI